MVLKIFEKIVQNFMEYLKEINQRRNVFEQKLYDASRNEQLLQLMRIQKSLVYFVTALRSNEMLLMKMERTNFLGLNEEEKEFLDDLIVDNSQALEMANIYTNILSSTLDAFASIIANNQNQVLKRLAVITIVLTFPVLISSIFGMNVPSGFEHSPYAFYIVVFLSLVISLIIGWLFLTKKNILIFMHRFNLRVYGILINEKKQVLVSDEYIRGNYYTKFPGGGLEFGEGTRDCLKREFMEEMNLNVEIGDHIYTTDYFQMSAFNPEHQIISIYYFAKALEEIKVPLTR